VHWLENGNGLRFGHYGTILSSNILERTRSNGPSCSLEIWLEPARTWNTSTVLAFYRSLNPGQFSLQQSHADLLLQRDIGDDGYHSKPARIYVDDVLRKEVFITVTSSGRDTAVYIDGRLITRSLRFGLSMNDLAGQLIGANSPLQPNSWPGQLRGLAIYRSELNAAQVVQHYEDWTQKGKPTVVDNESALALYLFDEHTGRIIHNRVRSGTDLYIPERYLVVHQILLEPPWREFNTPWSYVKSAFINIAGFVPLGFFFYAYFSSMRGMRCAAVATVFLGSILSLMIEVLQAHLPTRDSGVTDIITNTLGTGFGVVLYRDAALRLTRVFAAKSSRLATLDPAKKC